MLKRRGAAEITYDSSFLDGAEIYSKDGAILALNDNATLRMLKLNGVKTGFKGNNKTPMWTLYFLDDAARELNKNGRSSLNYVLCTKLAARETAL